MSEHVKSHGEEEILRGCIELMNGVYNDMLEFMDFIDADYSVNPDDETYPMFRYTYAEIVNRLFLHGTTHSGGTSTMEKCKELGVTDHYVIFTPETDGAEVEG